MYHPRSGEIGDESQKGSLAIIHNESGGITFRHDFYIRRSDGEYIQWGATKEESHPLSDTLGRAFGPDVYEGPAAGRTVGIFGLTHEQLLTSEWVTGDALFVKIKVEVLPPEDGFFTKTMKTSLVEVPAPTICSHFRALLDSGRGTDVTFRVKGEAIPAHSQILLARSEIFASQLFGSMRESISKEIIVEDCEVEIFKALLKFLYTEPLREISISYYFFFRLDPFEPFESPKDDFDHIQDLVEQNCKSQTHDGKDSRSASTARFSAEFLGSIHIQ